MKYHISDANSIEDMQTIASNQIQMLIWQMEEQIEYLKKIRPENVIDWDSYQKEIRDLEDISTTSIPALNELGEYYETMIAGNYW